MNWTGRLPCSWIRRDLRSVLEKLKDGKKVTLKEGDSFTLCMDEQIGDGTRVSVTYENLVKDVKPGDTILIDDGLIGLRVDELTEREIHCTVENGGELGEKKGVNVPNVKIMLPGVTEQDRKTCCWNCPSV